jgi:hypothetical protein
MSQSRKKTSVAAVRNRLIKQNNTMQLKGVRSQNMSLMKALSRCNPSSFNKTIKANERMQQRQIRAQNMSLSRTLKRSGLGTSDVKKRMKIQINADKRQNKELLNAVKANPSSWRKAVKRRMNAQLKAVSAQNKSIMS